jgi:hypothetical protein
MSRPIQEQDTPRREVNLPTRDLHSPVGEMNLPTGRMSRPSQEWDTQTGGTNLPTRQTNSPDDERSHPSGRLRRTMDGSSRAIQERDRAHGQGQRSMAMAMGNGGGWSRRHSGARGRGTRLRGARGSFRSRRNGATFGRKFLSVHSRRIRPKSSRRFSAEQFVSPERLRSWTPSNASAVFIFR